MMTGLLATSLAVGATSALAQDATPASGGEEMLTRTMILTNPEGKVVGNAKLTESNGTVTIAVRNSRDSGLAPGEHGIHIHETGRCIASGKRPYDAASGHLNPDGATHGGPDAPGGHAGDLGNLTVNDDGTFEFEIANDKVTLAEGAGNSLADEDGSALVIHEMADDLTSDPSGDSGSRVAYGVIFKSTVPAPAASPIASPEASPAA